MPISLTSLERKLARLQGQAARALLLTSPYIITTCWCGQSNQDKREPGMWERAQAHIDQWGIDFEALLEQPCSSSEGVLLRLACHLFNEQAQIQPMELMCLDSDNFQIALSALKLRKFRRGQSDFVGKYS